jgi:hypothetical protein
MYEIFRCLRVRFAASNKRNMVGVDSSRQQDISRELLVDEFE